MASPRSGAHAAGSPMTGLDIHAIIGELSTDDPFWLDLPQATAGAGATVCATPAGQQVLIQPPAPQPPLPHMPQSQYASHPQLQPHGRPHARAPPPHDPHAPTSALPPPSEPASGSAAHALQAAPAGGAAIGTPDARAELDGAELRAMFSLDFADKVPFMWERCTAQLRVAFAADAQAPADEGELAPLTVRVVSDKELLYSEKKRQWTWHKKWTLPRFSVELLSGGALLTGSTGLWVHVTAVVFNEADDRLDEVGLSGKTSAPYVGGMCSFQSLFFKSTSFNNKGASFHLLIGVVHRADTAGAPRRLLGCWSSSPIHVDARKRQLSELATATSGPLARPSPAFALLDGAPSFKVESGCAEQAPACAGAGAGAGAGADAGADAGVVGLGAPYGGVRQLQPQLGRQPGICPQLGAVQPLAADAVRAGVFGRLPAQLVVACPPSVPPGWRQPQPLRPAAAAEPIGVMGRHDAWAGAHATREGEGEARECDACTERHARDEVRWQQLLDLAHESVLQLHWAPPAPPAAPSDVPRPARLTVVDVLTTMAHGFARHELRGSDYLELVHTSERMLLKGVLMELGGEHSALRLQMRVLDKAGAALPLDGFLSIDREASASSGRPLLLLSTQRTPSWNASGGFHVDFVAPA